MRGLVSSRVRVGVSGWIGRCEGIMVEMVDHIGNTCLYSYKLLNLSLPFPLLFTVIPPLIVIIPLPPFPFHPLRRLKP